MIPKTKKLSKGLVAALAAIAALFALIALLNLLYYAVDAVDTAYTLGYNAGFTAGQDHALMNLQEF